MRASSKLISVLMSFALVLGLSPLSAYAGDTPDLRSARAFSVEPNDSFEMASQNSIATTAVFPVSGTWGTCPWEIDADGVLTVHPGIGANTGLPFVYEKDSYERYFANWPIDWTLTTGYMGHKSPWHDFLKSITEVRFVQEGSKRVVLPEDCAYLFAYRGESTSYEDNENLKAIDMNGVDFSCVKRACGMFAHCVGLESLGSQGWDVSNVENFKEMFLGCSTLKSIDVANWNMRSARDVDSLFESCSNLELLDVSKWNVSGFTSMYDLFAYCRSISRLDLSMWDVSNVTCMYGMFHGCSSLREIGISSWNVSGLGTQEMYGAEWKRGCGSMFTGCRSLASLDLSSWDVSNAVYLGSMFRDCEGLTSLDLSEWDIGAAKDISWMFIGCDSLEQLDVSTWDTSNVTDMSEMFNGCRSLKAVDVSNWDTSNVQDMSGMFFECLSLEELDVSSWDTSRVANMASMFWMYQSHGKLKELDVSNWDTSHVTDMSHMFYTSGITFLDLSNWDTSCVEEMDDAFSGIYGVLRLGRNFSFKSDSVRPLGHPDGIWFDEFGNRYTSSELVASYDGSTMAGFFMREGYYGGSVENAVISGLSGFYYTVPGGVRPGVQVMVNGKVLQRDRDYTVEYHDNTSPGTGYMVIEGIGTYTGSRSVEFKIVASSGGSGASSDGLSSVAIPYYSHLADSGNNSTTLKLRWGRNLFKHSSSRYDNRIAIGALAMSGMIEHSGEDTEAMLKKLGFTKTAQYDFNSASLEVERPATVFGHMSCLIAGKQRNVYCVVVRGTTDTADILTDAGSVFGAFSRASNRVMSNLDSFMTYECRTSLSNARQDGDIFLVTGHSLGGAVANLVANGLESYCDRQDIFGYTFATPRSTTSANRSSNVYNILNSEDQVPVVFSTQTGRHGSDRWWSRKDYSDNIYTNFGNVTGGKNLKSTMESLWLFDSTPFLGSMSRYAHSTDTYMAYLLSRHDIDKWQYSIRRARVFCPVDVEVYSGTGTLLGRIVDNEVDSTIPQGVFMEVDGDRKYVYLPYEGDYEFRLTGTDSGSMDFAVTDYDLATDEECGGTEFADVALEAGKMMVARVEGNASGDEDSGVSDIHLYVVDVNGNRVAEVSGDDYDDESNDSSSSSGGSQLSNTISVPDDTAKSTSKLMNPMTAKAKKKSFTVKASKVKKKAQKVTKPVSVKAARGAVTYANASKKKALKKFKVAKGSGTVTVPKKTKKGTYKVAVKVTAAGDDAYNPASKTVTVKVKVK